MSRIPAIDLLVRTHLSGASHSLPEPLDHLPVGATLLIATSNRPEPPSSKGVEEDGNAGALRLVVHGLVAQEERTPHRANHHVLPLLALALVFPDTPGTAELVTHLRKALEFILVRRHMLSGHVHEDGLALLHASDTKVHVTRT